MITIQLAGTHSAFARRRALVIGIDGCRGDLLQQVAQSGSAPNIEKLMKSGIYASCENPHDRGCARTHSGVRGNILGTWDTASGWTSVATGVDSTRHRVLRKGKLIESSLAQTSKLYPTFLSTLKSKGFKTAAGGVAAFLSVPGDEGEGVNPGVIDYECGKLDRGFLDFFPVPVILPNATFSCNLHSRFTPEDPSRDDRDDLLIEFISKQIEEIEDSNNNSEQNSTQNLNQSFKGADVIMGVLDLVDSAGHGYGFSANAGYLNSMVAADGRIGKVLTLIQKRVDRWRASPEAEQEEWLVVMTADHGGHDNLFSEGGAHDYRCYRDTAIPFTVTVYSKEPYLLEPLNYPVKHMDTAATILRWFGVDCPQCDGQVQGLDKRNVTVTSESQPIDCVR